ncbi:hypothetical protein CONPUDRAFT_148038 [Coniophora puteana RWD-64-598 SS2]|uniref:Cytochrome P450 n=1 Tax=Coniophora puteana (strain RWD-64-598) TaxID=741705 RepID=A0A5M3N4D4_CONPW|nr:uncharacterized protein CONPUDRAFT_148038 [Coniophora puteana RWD-64-598 SS2]EIW85904.1 hypothetical protein CONPUDRAFT_148038 [Coniophora puteana RWD-64-598 SS2]
MEAATEIMEKDGASNIDRSRNIIATELLANAGRIIMESGGDRFRKMRRAVFTALQPKASESYQPLQIANARILMLKLLQAMTDLPTI